MLIFKTETQYYRETKRIGYDQHLGREKTTLLEHFFHPIMTNVCHCDADLTCL